MCIIVWQEGLFCHLISLNQREREREREIEGEGEGELPGHNINYLAFSYIAYGNSVVFTMVYLLQNTIVFTMVYLLQNTMVFTMVYQLQNNMYFTMEYNGIFS